MRASLFGCFAVCILRAVKGFKVVPLIQFDHSQLSALSGVYRLPSNPSSSIQIWKEQRRHSSCLPMMFDQLSAAISEVAKALGPKQRMTEKAIQPALRQVRRALLDADVNVDVADTLIEGVRRRSLGQEVIKGVTAEQQFIKAMYDELLDMMGGASSVDSNSQGPMTAPLATLAVGKPNYPAVILLAGLQGAGKTTAAGKLALYLKEREVDYDQVAEMTDDARVKVPSGLPKRNRKVLLVAADVYRPAAIQQLEILGKSIGVDVFALGTETNPVEIVRDGVEKAKRDGYDTVIVDTAGRQVIDIDLMNELRQMKTLLNPDETLLIVDAMTGQEAASLTAAFDSAVGLTGAILTKMDGDSRGGAAVSVRGVSGKPIKFVGTGEKTADLEPFYPDRMASRILGMGDVVSLVEKAAAEVSDAEAAKMQQKMLDATFDFNDFLKQTELVAKMGSMANIAKMMPGLGGNINTSQLRSAEIRMKKSKALICSMTKQERANPDLLIKNSTSRSRMLRITRGSGLDYDDGIQFLSEFQKMRTMMSRMQKQMGGNMSQVPSSESDNAAQELIASPPGNRAARRSAKKRSKVGRSGGGGFG
jgi:signal recognition particle subunit SRP54